MEMVVRERLGGTLQRNWEERRELEDGTLKMEESREDNGGGRKVGRNLEDGRR